MSVGMGSGTGYPRSYGGTLRTPSYGIAAILDHVDDWAPVTLVLFGSTLAAFFFGFSLVSVREGENRAARVAAGCGAVAAALSLLLGAAPSPIPMLAVLAVAALLIAALAIWSWPVGRSTLGGGRPSRIVDERDTMFARARLRPGTQEYDTYYAMRPENRAGDDRTRALPGLLSNEAELADPVVFAAADANFAICHTLRTMAEGEPVALRLELSPEEWTRRVTSLTSYLGAVDVGICRLRPEHVYSNIGRGTGTWGAPVELDHQWAIAFTVEMDHGAISRAPGAPVVLESARQYVELSRIAVEVADTIRRWGWPARAHTDGNYRVIAPLVARDAGLGEIGRMGLLMTPQLGPRVRIGAVTTDLPLEIAPPDDDLSVLDFCTICSKCADNCPVGAIPHGDRGPIDGGLRWAIDSETCFRYWNVVGTDCAMCMRVCPYSHPDNAVHGLVRWAIRRSGGARRAMLKADDLFYGRRPQPRGGRTSRV